MRQPHTLGARTAHLVHCPSGCEYAAYQGRLGASKRGSPAQVSPYGQGTGAFLVVAEGRLRECPDTAPTSVQPRLNAPLRGNGACYWPPRGRRRSRDPGTA